MRNNITRTDLGSRTPFDFLKDSDERFSENLENPIKEDLIITDPIEDKVSDVDLNPEPLKKVEEDHNVAEDTKEVEDVANVKIKTNVAKLLADRLKNDGLLPEDFEVKESTTANDVENAYRKFLSDKIREEEKSAALEQLREEGYDDSVLNTAKKLHYGVSEQEIKLEQAYTVLGNLEISSYEENYEDLTKVLFEQYYLDKGLSKEEAQKNANRDFSDEDDIDSLIQSRKNYFSNRAIELEDSHKELVRKAKLDEENKKNENIQKIKNLLDKRVLDGVTYTETEIETVRKALFEKSEVIVMEDGKRVRVTPYQKKRYDRSRNEEQTLKDIADFILGYGTTEVNEAARKAARKKLVDDMNDLIEVEVVVNKDKREASGVVGEIQRRPLD